MLIPALLAGERPGYRRTRYFRVALNGANRRADVRVAQITNVVLGR